MATSVEQAMQGLTEAHGAPTAAAPAIRPGTDPSDFTRANRIHVQHGSLFIDPNRVIHPRDLDPANEAELYRKMDRAEGIKYPSFYGAADRAAIALNLGQLVPVSLAAKRSKLMDQVQAFNAQVDSGIDTDLQKEADDRQLPFHAILRDTIKDPAKDPVGAEVLQNGLSIYLLLRQKLTQNHYLNRLTDYVARGNSADQVLQNLAEKIGTSPQAVREAALSGGIDGVGALLGLDPNYVSDVKAISAYAAEHGFGYNAIEHWHLGRQLNSTASFEEKLATGRDARITHKINEYRGRARHYYDVPDPIKREEERIVREDMAVLEPIQRQLMFALGYEICHTPEYYTTSLVPRAKETLGLHIRSANDSLDYEGSYHIYYSGGGSRQKSTGTLAHEVAHILWPSHFSAEENQQIDQLVASERERFASLSRMMEEKFTEFERLHNAYLAGDAKEKSAIVAAANEQFKPYGITVDGLFPHLTDATSFRFLVWDANNVLQVEGAFYNKSSYHTPQDRFREVISRFAETRQVTHRDESAMLKFVAPGLTKVWEEHYIPHLERVYQGVVAEQAKKSATLPTSKAQSANDNDIEGQAEPIASAQASASPVPSVDRTSIQHNNLTQSALNELHAMGVQMR